MLGGPQTHVGRAALLVAAAALLETTLSPLLTFGWVGPRFLVLGVVVAAVGLKDLQSLLLGFFGGVLTDTLSGGLFGAGALGGVLAAAASMRFAVTSRKGSLAPSIALAAALAVVAYDLLGLFAPVLAGQGVPPLVGYLFAGVVPDAFLNGVVAYLAGPRLLKLITAKEDKWT